MIKKITALLLVILILILSVSCGNHTSEGNISPETEEKAPEGAKETTPVETDAKETETLPPDEPRTPVENDEATEFIEYQYARAVEAFEWITKENMPINIRVAFGENGATYYKTANGMTYALLDNSSITTFSLLEKYLRGIFDTKIADELVETAKIHYADFDGYLCCLEFGPDIETIYPTDEGEEETTNVTDNLPEPDMDEDIPEEQEPQRELISTEYFLSQFEENLMRYTAKLTYKVADVGSATDPESAVDDNDSSETREVKEYIDFIFENTANGWRWTSFPQIPQM